ncbi:MAG: cysteine peptidase family C39 domain-containing protein [Isosphaeraceae bacterium]|nr:cysteine peptidase family C39 domain-containing protein [Isosphaeraceae bacterium]
MRRMTGAGAGCTGGRRRIPAAALSVLLAATLLGVSPAQSADPPPTTNEPGAPAIPDNNVCGVNSLYMFLRSWGHSISPDEVRRKTPVGYYGSSLQDLKNAAQAMGVDVRIYHCGLEDLGKNCDLPAIAYMKTSPRLGTPTREYRGHFVLVSAVEPGPKGLVYWYDGTIGIPFNRPKDSFDQWWSGYVLSRPRRAGLSWLAPWATVAHVAAWALVLWWIKGRLTRRRPTQPAIAA